MKGLIFEDTLENVPEEYRRIGMQIEFANDKWYKKKIHSNKNG